jgi:hypothetical protein
MPYPAFQTFGESLPHGTDSVLITSRFRTGSTDSFILESDQWLHSLGKVNALSWCDVFSLFLITSRLRTSFTIRTDNVLLTYTVNTLSIV